MERRGVIFYTSFRYALVQLTRLLPHSLCEAVQCPDSALLETIATGIKSTPSHKSCDYHVTATPTFDSSVLMR